MQIAFHLQQFSRSPSSILETGIPVQLATTSAISSSLHGCAAESFPSGWPNLRPGSVFQFGNTPVLQFGHSSQISGPTCSFQFNTSAVEFLLDVLTALNGRFSAFQISSKSANSRLCLLISASDIEPLQGCLIVFFFNASRSIFN